MSAELRQCCNRGIGHATAIHLDSLDYHVFSSCLFPTGPGVEELKNKCSCRLQVLGMNITKDESVQEALEFIKENLGTSQLWAVVNNAGILKGFSIEITPMQDFQDNIEVNLYGHIRITKAFLPLLRQSNGRLVNFTSLIGRMVLCHCAVEWYCAKFGAVGFTQCLRQEMNVWGVSVISIEPEIYKYGWNGADWGRLVFSHESRFQLCSDDHRRRVSRRTG
ncbi:estradiol 17-beta-dehydrogenase 2 [Parasteatoda tepidariorum]|uniref:estradiol 17-beta-dehydrogenase 2 n=1 Tax=Parasteatoda tepidariorum TaxID=114398 RepID=UPI0039BC2C65